LKTLNAFILISILSYLIGSIPSGLIISKIFRIKDPRKSGSGNIGATNVARSGGIIAGILTLIFDALKGFIPVYFANKLNIHYQLPFFAGIFAFLGHLYPIYLKFKGGKGVATSIGIFLALVPYAVLIGSIVFFIIAFSTRYISLASIITALLFPGIIKILLIFKIYSYDYTITYFAGFISIFIIYKHKDNIVRLIKGKELKFGKKS